MNTLTRTSCAAVILAFAGGCSSHHATPASSAASTPAVALGKSCTMHTVAAGGKDILQVTIPADATCTSTDGALRIESHDRDSVFIWLVPGARTVEEGVGAAAKTIESEFKNFKPAETAAATIAGAPARRLSGPGNEADDGDDGTADVIVFTVGGRVFVACVHGEHMAASARALMPAIAQTARKP